MASGPKRELYAAARQQGASDIEACLEVIDYFRPMVEAGGDLAAGAALWQSQQYEMICLHLGESGTGARDTRDIVMYGAKELNCLKLAVQSTDEWVRGYAYNALFNALRAREDGPGLRAAVDGWKAAYPGEVSSDGHWWYESAKAADLPPLTLAQKAQLIRALTAWVSNSPDPDEVMMYMGRDALSPRTTLEHMRSNTETGQALFRMYSLARTEMSWDEVCETFEGSSGAALDGA